MITVDKKTMIEVDKVVYEQWNMMFHAYLKTYFGEEAKDMAYIIVDGNDFYVSDGEVANAMGNCMLGYGFSMCPFYGYRDMKEIRQVRASVKKPSRNLFAMMYGIYLASAKAEIQTGATGYIGSLKPFVSDALKFPSKFDLYAFVDGTRVCIDGREYNLEEFVDEAIR